MTKLDIGVAILKFKKESGNKLGKINMRTMNVDDLKPASYNPRKMNDKARQGLSNSIDTFGLVQPIIYNEMTGNIVGGHQRLYDLINKGVNETDVVVVNLSESKEKALNIALNASTITGTFENDLLQEMLLELEHDPIYDDLNFGDFNLTELEPKNFTDKEVNVDMEADNVSLVLNFNLAQFKQVSAALHDINESKEIALLTLLGL